MADQESNIVEVEERGTFRYERHSFFGVGQESFSTPPSQSQESFFKLENILPAVTGDFQRRWGYSRFNTGPLTVSGVPRRLFEYQNDASSFRRILITSRDAVGAGVQVLDEGGGNTGSAFTPSTGADPLRAVTSRDSAYFSSGDASGTDLKKWNSTSGSSKWGIVKPATALVIGAPVAGVVTLEVGREYTVVFRNSTTGHVSGISPFAGQGPVTNQNIPLSSIPTSADSQVNSRIILATSDGGGKDKLFQLTIIGDNTTTTFTDNVTETSLIGNPVYLETDEFGIEHGVADNDPPPAGAHTPIKHRGRIFMAQGPFLFFSKNRQETLTSTGTITGVYEEAWPADFFRDVSRAGDTVKGLFSDGEMLYIGTTRAIKRLTGDGPLTFNEIESVFESVGLATHETWQTVYIDNVPVGSMWLTPEYRVVLTDSFNSYADVGVSIQDILNTINSDQIAKANAAFIGNGEYNLYSIAIPTGVNTEPDTLGVFDLKSKRWVIWKPTDKIQAQLYRVINSTTANGKVGTPQNLLLSDTTELYRIDDTVSQDKVGVAATSFTAEIQTIWSYLGDPTIRKLLNEIELFTGDTSIQVTVEGASTQAEFTSPATVISASVPITGPLGDLKVMLAGQISKDKFYRIKFVSPASTTENLLSGYTLEFIPYHRL